MLTRGAITQDEKDKVSQAKIILGENILAADANQQQQAKRNEFQQKVEAVLQQKFKGKQSLDYKELWSSDLRLNLYLKIISALRFEAKWLDGKFEKIGKHQFTSFDKQQLTVDYMKNKIEGFTSYDNTSKWKSVRILYENNYALDIIIPQAETEYTNTDKSEIITNLIATSNSKSYKHNINLQMPLFTFKEKVNITSMLQEMFPSFKNKDIELAQECVIKVDEEGTIAESITSMFVFESFSVPEEVIINSGFYYMLSEVEEIKNLLYSYYEIKNIIMIGAVNNPLLDK
jgi:serine protease inhibitor